MSMHVICPGCLKQFQVAARFAGMQGPCPNCTTIIPIPKESVKIHGNEEVGSKSEKKSHILSHPIPRFHLEFNPTLVRRYALCVLGVISSAFLIGCIPMYVVCRSLLGTLGLCLIAFPLVLFGYQFIRDRGEIFAFSGKDLYYRAGIVASGYVILWIGFEYFLAETHAGGFFSWFYFVGFAVLAALLVHLLLAMKTPDAFLHYCFFGLSVGFLRFLIGFGWFWESVRYSSVPLPPSLPGM